jgi:hypothetical protein
MPRIDARRRRLLQISVAALGASTLGVSADAQPAKLSESDPQAVALGYKTDTKKVDKAKYPKHTPAQMCKNCQFFQGKPADQMGPCPLFGGKLVHATGWCSAYVKKA